MQARSWWWFWNSSIGMDLYIFQKRKFGSWKRQARQVNIKFSSPKNTFKKIKCLDHVVGVLRYVACKDGQQVGRRVGDGLVTHPHTHYARQPIDEKHRHERGRNCSKIRDEISEKVATFLGLSCKTSCTTVKLVCVIVVRRVKKNEVLQMKSVEFTTKLKLVWRRRGHIVKKQMWKVKF